VLLEYEVGVSRGRAENTPAGDYSINTRSSSPAGSNGLMSILSTRVYLPRLFFASLLGVPHESWM
jgi:hypothetical protein